jgi:hypothetical protein
MRDQVIHKRMIAPPAGFTVRVMARIEERERAQARRRAVIGATLLVVVAGIALALVCIWLTLWIGALLARPGTVISAVLALSPLADGLRVLLEALWVAASAVTRGVGGEVILAYALAVLALTILWARVATGNHPSLSLRAGSGLPQPSNVL